MTVTEKVKETATDLKESLRETVEDLKADVAQLKEKVGQLVSSPRGRGNVPVRRRERSPAPHWSSAFDDPWFGSAWPSMRLARLLDLVHEELFDGVVGGWPQVDVTETDREIRVRVELPGVEEDDLEVSLDGDLLTIRGEKRTETEDRSRDYYRHECYYGSFQRTIPLRWDVDVDRIDARFRRGVLHVTLPKSGRVRERLRRIPVAAT